MTSNTYNAVPYSSKVNRGRHLDKLRCISLLAGIDAPDPKTSSVLELGCSTGEHLIPLAIEFPNAKFIGIDYSESQIAAANDLKNRCGVTNIEFICESFESLNVKNHQFDYILCHGVYSWVSDSTRETLLSYISASLKENGCGYVSYNTYPGWHIRESVRQMLRYYDRPEEDLTKRIENARDVLTKFQGSVTFDYDRPHTLLFQTEIHRILKEPDHYILHEFLTPENKAFHYSEFVSDALKHGLQAIGDARFSRMSTNRLLTADVPPLAFKNVIQLSENAEALEQTMDFLFFNVFRETLLTKKSKTPLNELTANDMRKFLFTTHLHPSGEEEIVFDRTEQQFSDVRGVSISTGNPFLKGCIQVLQEEAPNYISFDELVSKSEEVSPPDNAAASGAEILAAALLEWAQKEVIDFALTPPVVSRSVSEFPKTTQFIREMTRQSEVIPNLFYNSVEIGPLEKEFLLLADGEHDRAKLSEHAHRLMFEGTGGIMEDGVPVTDPERQKELVGELVESTLLTLQKAGLLL